MAEAQRGDGVVDRPGLRRAEAEPPGDRRRGLGEGRLAVLDVEEGAGRGPVQRQGIEIRHVVDMHVRPDVQAAPDMPDHAGLPRRGDQRRDLHAVGIQPGPGAVDQAVAQHHRPHAAPGGVDDQPVDGDPRRLARHRLDRRVLVMDPVRGPVAAGVVGHHAGAAGVQERLAAAGERVEHGLHRRPVVGAGGVDHRIGRLRLPRQQSRVRQVAQHRLDAQRLQPRRLLRRPHQAADPVPVLHQPQGDGAADIAAGAGQEDGHADAFVCVQVLKKMGAGDPCREAVRRDKLA